MSSWTTLNIEGISSEELPDAFEDWWAYEQDGTVVAYSFNPDLSPEEAAVEVVKAGDHHYEPSVENVLVLRCNDTSDYVIATLFWPRSVKWNGVKPGLTWSGSHAFGREDSPLLQNAPDDTQPIFGGNWSDRDE